MTSAVPVITLRPVMGGCEQGLGQKGNDLSHIGELELEVLSGLLALMSSCDN